MAFKDLKILTTKEYRIYLILIIWLLIGHAFYQFEATIIVGFVILLPLIILTFILFLISVLSFKNLTEMSKKRLIVSILIMLLLILLFINFFVALALLTFVLSIISYIIITTIFTMFYFYFMGVKIDDYLYNLPQSIKKFERWSVFIGGIIFSIISLIVASIVTEYALAGTGAETSFNTAIVALFLIIVIVVLAIIGLIESRKGRLNAWMGIFFIWVAIYSIYLMISIKLSFTSSESTTSIPIQIVLYFFGLFILLNTIGGLVGQKANVLKQKLRIISSDTILIWLIFSLASLEFASGEIITAEVELVRYIIIYVLFIPLTFLIGLYGIKNYGNILKGRQIKHIEKQAKKEGIIEKDQLLCKECGAANLKSAQFCAECGAELK